MRRERRKFCCQLAEIFDRCDEPTMPVDGVLCAFSGVQWRPDVALLASELQQAASLSIAATLGSLRLQPSFPNELIHTPHNYSSV